jgi:hypothetical protein
MNARAIRFAHEDSSMINGVIERLRIAHLDAPIRYLDLGITRPIARPARTTPPHAMMVQIKQSRPSPLFSIAVSMVGFGDRVPQ